MAKKSMVFLVIAFILVYLGMRSNDIMDIQETQEKFKVKSDQVATVTDLLYLYNCINHDSICQADSFFAEINTPFGEIIRAKQGGVVTRSFSTSKEEVIYSNYCHLCHDTGVMNAPKVLPNKQIEILASHAWNGYSGDKGQMPARGLCGECDSTDLAATILWMQTNKTKE